MSGLKNRTKVQESLTLAASALEVYKVDIPVSDYGTLMESVSQNTVEYEENHRLRNPLDDLSIVFGATGPLVKTLHVLVEQPGGELFSSS